VKRNWLTFSFLMFASCSVAAQISGVDADVQNSIEHQFEMLATDVERDVASLHDLAQSTNSKDARNISGTVTSDLARSFTDVPADITKSFQRLQTQLLQGFEKAARAIEYERRSRLLNNADAKLFSENLPAAAAARLETIISAVGENNASILRVYLAMQIFETINNKLIDEAMTTQDPMRTRALYMQQAAHVYEISSSVIAVLQQHNLTGLASLTGMKEGSQSRIYRRLAAINQQRNRLRDEVRSGKLSDDNARRMERSYVQIIKVNQAIADVWHQLLQSTAAQQDYFERIPALVSLVQQKQQLAKFQLETLRDVLIIGDSFEPLERVEGGMLVAQLPLLQLDQSFLMQLISGSGGVNASP